jgi:asparagine synthase (glutamine-hydrolysing)
MSVTEESEDPALAGLDGALDAALDSVRARPGPTGVLFSGGVDSALLAWELRTVPGVRLFTVGVDGSPDLGSAESAAILLGLPWTGSAVRSPEVQHLAHEIADELRDLGWVDRSVQVAFALAVDRAPRVPLVCGQGIDELFLGYAHYRCLAPADALRRSEQDLEKLLDRDWPRAQRIAARRGRSVVAPYLHPAFVAAARRIPIEARLPDPVPKALFRDWAGRRGVPGRLLQARKRALQYGSGVDRVLSRSR